MRLERFDETTARITDAQGDVFDGECVYDSAEYCEAEFGRSEDALELLRLLLPETHDPQVYQAEPFVLPADVSSAPGCEGLAGWTWYTGSAGWYYRTAVRELLGLQLEGGLLYIRPKLADYEVRWTDDSGRSYHIEVHGFQVTVDGEAYSGEGLGGTCCE